MSKEKRSKGLFSFFSKLFIRNETPYPAALDGRVMPWIPISNAKSKRLKNTPKNKKIILKVKGLKTAFKKPVHRKTLKLSPLETELKKQRLLIILKNNKPLKKRTLSLVKARPVMGFVLPKTALPTKTITLRASSKISASDSAGILFVS